MAYEKDDRVAFTFMERLAERGIGYAGSYLESESHCLVRVLDEDGVVLFVSANAGDMPRPLESDELTYNEEQQLLSVSIPQAHGKAHIDFAPVKPEDVERIIKVVDDIAMPLSYHLMSYRSTQRKIANLRNDLSARLFKNRCASLAAYLRTTGQPFDEAASYSVAITRNDHSADGIHDWAATTEGVRRYLDEQGAFDVIDIGIDEGFVHLFPSDYLLVDVPAGSSRGYDLARHKSVHDRRNGLVTSVGIGRPYSFADLEQSYREANIALEFGWLTGKVDAVTAYDDLGVFSLLLDLDHEALLDYCEGTLSPLIEFESTHGTPLLDTLRHMLDTSFRWTDVSRLLFIHVNTLRYRMDKIGELLQEDFSLASVRSNYYFVVKAYDLLRAERR